MIPTPRDGSARILTSGEAQKLRKGGNLPLPKPPMSMARKVRTNFIYVVFSIFCFAYLSHHYLHRHPNPGSLSSSSSSSSSSILTTTTADDDIIPIDDHDHLLLDGPQSQPQPTSANTITTFVTSSSSSSPSPSNSYTQAPPVPEIQSLSPQHHTPHVSESLSPHHHTPHLSSPSSLDTVSILLPDWEVLLILSPQDTAALRLRSSSSSTPSPDVNHHVGEEDHQYYCLFPNKEFSPAKPSGMLSFPDRATFKCNLPNRIRRRLPFPNPLLTNNPTDSATSPPAWTEMIRWTYVAYDSLTTEEDDVVVFAKGPNHRQGFNRDPSEFNCVFYREGEADVAANGVRTTVTNSVQEVFRCKRPPPELQEDGLGRIKVTVETVQDKQVVPSVAYYNPSPRKLAINGTGITEKKSVLCACTMVYNVAKFLKEWVIYHSNLGVQRFVLYDNESDDDLHAVVAELVSSGYDVTTYFWLWPKSQEAGFSHSTVYLRDSCAWTAYLDVDEFIYSPAWSKSVNPSHSMLHSLLLTNKNTGPDVADDDDDDDNKIIGKLPLGEVYIECREFGPSNQTEHPSMGVMQGYNCRKRGENRHKSIVFLKAVDDSLFNAIHHFNLKPGYVGKKIKVHKMTVNHYKFQAWSEFKAKFRRRVSAYVVDWTRQVNPGSNDRTPGLGYEAVEPPNWAQKFCEVEDDGLKELALKWFGKETDHGYKMAWQ